MKKYAFILIGIIVFLFFMIHAFNTNMFGSAWVPISITLVAAIFGIDYIVKQVNKNKI